MCPSERISSSSGDNPPAKPPSMNITSQSSLRQLSIYSSADDSGSSTQSTVSCTGNIQLQRMNSCSPVELRPPGTVRGCTDWYDMCTESLGFESMSEKMDVENVVVESRSRMPPVLAARSRRFSNMLLRPRSFPPVLSTMDESGQSRFSMEIVRTEDGRLKITMVEMHRPVIVRTRSDEGRVVMMWNHGQEDQKDGNDEEQEDD